MLATFVQQLLTSSSSSSSSSTTTTTSSLSLLVSKPHHETGQNGSSKATQWNKSLHKFTSTVVLF